MNLDDFKQFIKIDESEVKRNNEVWLYTRVSSKDQFANKSLLNQHDEGKTYCLTNQYNLVKVFGETYESARGDFTRKEFKNLIDSIRRAKKKPFAILIYKMSRFSRTGGHAIGLATDLIEGLGVHLIEISSGKNTLTERGKLEIYDRLLKAREENLERLEITLPGLKKFIENGNWLGSVPKGYDHYGPRVKDLNRISGEQRIVLNREGKLFKKAWRWKVAGERDCDIIRKLDALGVRISDKQISKMWRNPFYCGLIINKLTGDQIIAGNHEPVVSKKDFLLVNKRLRERTETYQGYKGDENLPLNKFIKSYECGTSYSGYCVKAKGIYYYKNNRKGSKENVSAKKMHESFAELLRRYQILPAVASEYEEVLYSNINDVISIETTETKVQRERVDEIGRKIKRLDDRYVLEEITREQRDEHVANFVREREQILANLKYCDKDFSNLKEAIKKGVQLSKNLAELWIKGTFAAKQAIQSMLFPEGILYDFKNNVSRTSVVNLVFSAIPYFSDSYKGNKKGGIIKFDNFPLSVAGAGLEPATFGL
ncbi:recombinase family protein [Fulvivirga kasyanovii]|uniref:recombinase family protein n=1 Tax=Fulvivirga kasyanovii TaxID=396812 RepID=UPI003374426C